MTNTTTPLTIAERFAGPPGCANGGFVCGLLAERLAAEHVVQPGALSGAVQVRLRRPTPLGTGLALERGAPGAVLRQGTELLAEAGAAEAAAVEVAPPPALLWGPELGSAARAAAGRFAGLEAHPYPSCFVCGPARALGEGLRIFAGPDATGAGVAAPWVPEAWCADATGRVPVPLLWAALDCPGYFAVAPAGEPALLGTMTAQVRPGAVRAGDACVVVAWALGAEGRKRYAATLLYGADGAVCGRSRQLWITS